MQGKSLVENLKKQPFRTGVELTGTSSPDYYLHNADWTKNTWDLPPFKSAAEFKQYLRQRGQTVEQFKKLPVYNARNRPTWLKDL